MSIRCVPAAEKAEFVAVCECPFDVCGHQWFSVIAYSQANKRMSCPACGREQPVIPQNASQDFNSAKDIGRERIEWLRDFVTPRAKPRDGEKRNA